jgi:hypothetical protein
MVFVLKNNCLTLMKSQKNTMSTKLKDKNGNLKKCVIFSIHAKDKYMEDTHFPVFDPEYFIMLSYL